MSEPKRPWHDGPVVDLLMPMPLVLASEIMEAVATACEKHGLEAYFTEADGLGRIHARPAQVDNTSRRNARGNRHAD
jgi:hypothetical protein